MLFYSISRQLAQPHWKQGKTCYPHLTKGEAETEHKNDCPVLLEKICSVGAGMAFDSLLFSTLVWLLCVSARILSYNDEISQLCLKWLEFLLALLSFCSILCSWLYQPQFYFLLIIMKWWKEAVAPQPERFMVEGDTQAFSTKSVCVGTDVGIHQISTPQRSSSNSFYFPTNQSFLTVVQGFPIVAILNKAAVPDLCNERRAHWCPQLLARLWEIAGK